MDDTGNLSAGDGPEAWSSRPGVHPDDITAPQPVIVGPHHHETGTHPHEGPAGAAVSPAGHHVSAPAATPVRRRGALAVRRRRRGRPGARHGRRLRPLPGGQQPGGREHTLGDLDRLGARRCRRHARRSRARRRHRCRRRAASGPSQPTLVLGDSLGLIVYPWLADLLPDRYVSYQAEVGRATPATLKKLTAMGSVPPVVIVSSGTNDPYANVLEESARSILDELSSARCVVWVDVVRPARVGDSQTAHERRARPCRAGPGQRPDPALERPRRRPPGLDVRRRDPPQPGRLRGAGEGVRRRRPRLHRPRSLGPARQAAVPPAERLLRPGLRPVPHAVAVDVVEPRHPYANSLDVRDHDGQLHAVAVVLALCQFAQRVSDRPSERHSVTERERGCGEPVDVLVGRPARRRRNAGPQGALTRVCIQPWGSSVATGLDVEQRLAQPHGDRTRLAVRDGPGVLGRS